jgi:hypothetical protein
MKSSQSEAAQEALRSVAERYLEQGYRVHVRPTGKRFPAALISLVPDMIIEKDGETRVVEVNFVGEADQKRIGKLARKVDALGWKMSFVVLRREILEDDMPNKGQVTRAEIRKIIGEVEQKMLAERLYKAAFVWAWTALEGTMRRLIEPNAESARPLPPLTLLNAVTSEGYISRKTSYVTRNAIVHILTHSRVTKASVLRVLRAIEELETKEGRRLAS